VTADEHHLQQVLVAIPRQGRRFELIEGVTRRKPSCSAQRIDQTPTRRNLQPRAGALRNLRIPTLDRRKEGFLHSGFDQVESTRTKGAR